MVNQTEAFRPAQIYVSRKTMRRLGWLRELEKGDTRLVTRDEIADRILNEAIEAAFPNISKLEKRLAALEDQLVMELGNGKAE